MKNQTNPSNEKCPFRIQFKTLLSYKELSPFFNLDKYRPIICDEHYNQPCQIYRREEITQSKPVRSAAFIYSVWKGCTVSHSCIWSLWISSYVPNGIYWTFLMKILLSEYFAIVYIQVSDKTETQKYASNLKTDNFRLQVTYLPNE